MKEIFYKYNHNNIYLDNAASTIPFQSVVDATLEFLGTYGSVHRGTGYNSEVSTSAYEESRSKILSIIDGTKDDCCIFTANTTDAINKMALAFPFKENEQVLISDIEHSSNTLPWYKHSKVVKFQTENFIIDPTVIETYLKSNANIRLVAISAASNITGYITDLKSIYEICQRYGVFLFVDASQLAAHSKPSLKYCDFIAYCGHKMYAPYGAGILAGNKKVLSNPGKSITGGGNVLYVSDKGEPIYKEAPFLHEAGTPNAVGAIALRVAHETLYEYIGSDSLSTHNNMLLRCINNASQILEENGYKVYFKEFVAKTPILVLDNLRKTNAETARLLSQPTKEYTKNIFLREGAFCAYEILERLKPNLKQEIAVENGKLNSGYSLIRLSAGILNTSTDIEYVAQKLVAINS